MCGYKLLCKDMPFVVCVGGFLQTISNAILFVLFTEAGE